MNGHSAKRIVAGALTVALAAALALPALGSAAPAPLSAVSTSRNASTAIATVGSRHVRAAAEVALAAERAASEAAAYTARTTTAKAKGASSGSELGRAQAILASLKSRYPRYLSGVTVAIGSARGHQAISYYTTGRIVVSPTHRASLERILGHEIWHVIDWRDNGHIDWGESIPPANTARFR